MSLITPLSLVSTERFAPAYQLLASTASCATFLTLSGDAHPSVLFAGVKMSGWVLDLAFPPQDHATTRCYKKSSFKGESARKAGRGWPVSSPPPGRAQGGVRTRKNKT